MKYLSSLTALALLAMASGPAFAAEGEYYEGVSPNESTRSVGIDRSFGYTGSVSDAAGMRPVSKAPVNSGDYYLGAERPI